jgi:hypothetical protein
MSKIKVKFYLIFQAGSFMLKALMKYSAKKDKTPG